MSSVQLFSCVQLFATPWTATRQASPSITSSRNLLKLMSIESVMPSKHLVLCRPLLLLPSILPRIRVFSNGSVLLIRWPKYWSFSFSISPSNEYSGLISFRMDWLDLLAGSSTGCLCIGRPVFQYAHLVAAFHPSADTLKCVIIGAGPLSKAVLTPLMSYPASLSPD